MGVGADPAGWASSGPLGYAKWLVLPLLLVLAFAGMAFAELWDSERAPRPFDEADWDAVSSRRGMAEHLVRTGALEERTREQVVQQLGEPEGSSLFPESDLVYGLAPGGGSAWLVVELGENGLVAEAFVAVEWMD